MKLVPHDPLVSMTFLLNDLLVSMTLWLDDPLVSVTLLCDDPLVSVTLLADQRDREAGGRRRESEFTSFHVTLLSA